MSDETVIARRTENQALLEDLTHEFPAGGGRPAAGLRLFFAPGRVNLLGAHLDYNGGFVLPCAIDRGTYLAIRPRRDGLVSLRSLSVPGALRLDRQTLPDTRDLGQSPWARYPVGVLHVLQAEGLEFGGMDLLFAGDLPLASGLSSSASLELVTAYAIGRIHGHDLSRGKLVEIAHRAENDFVGVRCGIMDQFAAAYGKRGHALFLDCATRELEYLPLDPAAITIAVTDTLRRRELASGLLNERVQECLQALETVRRSQPEIRTLRHLERTDLERHRHDLGQQLYARALHVVEECERCHRGAAALRRGDYRTLGRLLEQSHDSTRIHYEVSCKELDLIVEEASQLPGVHGSRLTGAGFGGCTVSLLAAGFEQVFCETIGARFEERFAHRPRIYLFRPSGGPCEIL